MQDKVVTVFGGSGFIGRYVVERLADLGAVVRVPTRRPEQALFLKPLGAIGQIVLEPWNPTASGEAERLLAGSDQAVSLIGVLFEGRKGEFDRLQARLPGEIARGRGARRPRARGPRLRDRSRAGSPVAYARTKAEGEAAMRAAFPAATILRPSVVFGPEDGFFNRFARMSQFLPVLPLIGGGRTRFQPVYVGDVAEAVIAGADPHRRRRPDVRARRPRRVFVQGAPRLSPAGHRATAHFAQPAIRRRPPSGEPARASAGTAADAGQVDLLNATMSSPRMRRASPIWASRPLRSR